ncbi:MAG TPA: hypothetical protein VK738_18300, partial [Terriglobales bacterium]|nr:hypothetical protein [Terriglobales bacterium]
LCHLGNSVLAVLKERTREQRRASGEAARAGKKPHYDRVSLNITPIAHNFNFHSKEEVPDRNTISPNFPPNKQDKPEDKKEAQPDQGSQNTVSPESAVNAKAQAKNQPQNEHNKPQPNGHSVADTAPPSEQPVSPPPQENPPVQYPPGLGPRYLSVATPCMPWWRRPQFNNPGFVTGTVPKTAAMPAPRFRGTRR